VGERQPSRAELVAVVVPRPTLVALARANDPDPYR
jgi:hypothetical protein